MNIYPDLPIKLNSPEETLDSVTLDRAPGGELRGRSFWDAPKMSFTLGHVSLDAAQKRSVQDFYADNRTQTFELDYDDVSYFVIFTKPPRYIPVGGGFWDIEFEVQEA